MNKKMTFALVTAMGIGALVLGQSSASADDGRLGFRFGGFSVGHSTHSAPRHYGTRHYGHYGTPHGYYGSRQPRGHYDWHDTSHYDWHPPQIYRHGNHYHYQPGHYDFHQQGHYDYHQGSHGRYGHGFGY